MDDQFGYYMADEVFTKDRRVSRMLLAGDYSWFEWCYIVFHLTHHSLCYALIELMLIGNEDIMALFGGVRFMSQF